MKNNRWKSNIIFVLIILVISIVVFVGYSFLFANTNIFKEIFKDSDKDHKVDNYNGFYLYEEPLNAVYYAFSGCTVNKINYYIAIVNDDYTYYKSTCMGTYLRKSGKVSDLDIKKDEDTDDYFIIYGDNKFKRNYNIKQVVPENSIAVRTTREMDLGSYQYVLRETQFEGNYYDYKGVISKMTARLNAYLKRNGDGFDFYITSSKNRVGIYKTQIENLDLLPDLYAYGTNLAIVDKQYSYNYPNVIVDNFLTIDSSKVIYDMNKFLPILVNDKYVTSEFNKHIVFDQKIRKFVVLFSENEKFCYDDSTDTGIAYYMFYINYSYIEGNFTKPEFVRVGYLNEGCGSINSYLGG